MIVRILNEGQYDVPDIAIEELNALDDGVVAAIDSDDASSFSTSLERLLEKVRERGQVLPDDFLGPSELILPGLDSSLEEVRSMLGDEGLIPG